VGRRKKSEIEAGSSPQSDLIVCPICGKEFKPTEETYCWVQEGRYEYKQVCSWACFRKRVDEVSAEAAANEKKKTTKKDTVKVDLSRTEKTNENKEETKEEENENA
jgi:hypothetical protein